MLFAVLAERTAAISPTRLELDTFEQEKRKRIVNKMMMTRCSLLPGFIFSFLVLLGANAIASDSLFNLIDNHGKPVTSSSYAGKVQVVFFGFAKCKDVCPSSLSTIKRTYDSLDSSLQKHVQPIFISIDPERDTVAKVDHFVKHMGDFIGLTGPVERIKETLRNFRVFAMQEIGKSDDDYDINHTSLIYLINKTGQPCDTIASDVSTTDLAQIISDIAEAKYSCKGFV